MTASQSQPITEYDNWVLHRQPEDQIVDHKFSLWSGEHPVVLANEMPGEDGALAYIVSELNSVARLTRLNEAYKGQVEAGAARIAELEKALRPFAAFAMRFGLTAREDGWQITQNPSGTGDLTMGDCRSASNVMPHVTAAARTQSNSPERQAP